MRQQNPICRLYLYIQDWKQRSLLLKTCIIDSFILRKYGVNI